MRPVDGSASARGNCGCCCCCWPSGKAASGSQFNWSAKGGQGEVGWDQEGAGGFGTEKVLGRKTSFKFEIFFAAGGFYHFTWL